jgi:hypothetical protein
LGYGPFRTFKLQQGMLQYCLYKVKLSLCLIN